MTAAEPQLTRDGFLLDMWETMPCSYCGVEAGELCCTRSGLFAKKSHSPRVFWVEPEPAEVSR